MSTFLYDRPRILFLCLAVIVALAAAAANSIGRQEDPTITNLFATIVTPFPGAAPDRVEALVTVPIEDELAEIEEIDEISSTSRTGISVVSVELINTLTDEEIAQTWSQIRDALSDAARAFPERVPEPEIDTDRGGSAYTTISALVMADGARPNPAIQKRYAEDLQDRLRALSNTKIVRLFGAETEEIRVSVDAERLAALGFTFDDVAEALSRADAKVQAGALQGADTDTLIEISGEIEDLSRIRQIPVGTGPAGTTVRIGAIATLTRGVADPPATLAYAGGQPAVLVAARMAADKQVDAWAANARDVFAEFEAALPGGLEHRLIFDQSRYVADRFQTLGMNLLIGVGLVLAVLFLSLGWRAATVVATVIPLATLLSVTVMQWIGMPIHQMSVTGLIVALGLLVDAAIVMCDDIRRRIAQRTPPREAVSEAVKRLAIPLLASTVTTVLAFMPMAILPGPAGDFVGSIAFAVIIMLGVSLLLAVTITPAIAGRLLATASPREPSPTLLSRAFDFSIRLSLRHKGLAILGALILPVMGFLSFPTLTAQFFPGVDRDQLYVQVTLPDGSSILETDTLANAVAGRIRARDEVAGVTAIIGSSAPSFYYNMVSDRDGAKNFAEILVTTASAESTEGLIPVLQSELDGAFPAAQIIVRGLVQGPPVDAPIELRIVGPSLPTLRDLGDDLRLKLTKVPTVTHARNDLVGGAPKIVFRLEEEKVRLAGLTLGDVARQLDSALTGALGGSLLEATEELPIRARLSSNARETIEAIRNLPIMPPGAAARVGEEFPAIPLSALGTIDVVPSDSAIVRRNRERVNTVQAFIERDVLPEEALSEARALLAEEPLPLPPGYRLEVGGDSDARSDTTGNLASTAGLVVTLMIVTIVLTFGAYRLSIIAFIVMGLSFGLAILALAVFQYPFGIQALIGAIGSIGVSINAAIIVLTGLRDDPEARAGDIAAIARVVSQQARHIVSTTITTVGGFVPLIVGGGGFWPPFAMAIAGGVFLSMVVSFYFVPPMFALLHRGRKKADTAQTEGDLAPATA